MVKSEYYKEWEEYKAAHPEIAEIEAARTLQQYEEGIFLFIFDLFK